MQTRYERVLWMTRIALTPGPMQVLVHTIWESGCLPPTIGPFRRALQVVRLLGWQPLEGWCSWAVPGQTEPLHPHGAGAHAADPAYGAGQSASSCHAHVGGPPSSNL